MVHLPFTLSPLPEWLSKDVENKFLWGTNYFTLSRVIAYKPIENGELGLSAMGLWFTVNFMCNYFYKWTLFEQEWQMSICLTPG